MGVMTIHSLCRDEEWRMNFVNKGGLNYAVKLLFCILCGDALKDQECQLTNAYIINALYEICYGHCHTKYPRHCFIRNAVMMIERNRAKMQTVKAIPTHVLIHAICRAASSSKNIDFVDELPRNFVCLHSLPLIRGYLRSECDSSLYIPDGIVKLMAHFF